MTHLLDALWIHLNAKAGICSSAVQIDDTRNYLKKGQDYADYASKTARLAALDPNAPILFRNGAEALGKVRTGLKTANDLLAARQIADAICVLNGWVEVPPKRSDAEAARAFDQLFGGAAQFASKLPPPLNAYSQILSEISKNSFFTKMQQTMRSYNFPDEKEAQKFFDEDTERFRPR